MAENTQNFHEMHRAARDWEDNEADLIASKIPPEITAMGGYLHEIPKRGTVSGAERIRAANRVTDTAERYRNIEAERVASAKKFETDKAELSKWESIRATLSLGIFEPLPPEFTRDELEKWAVWLRENPNEGAKFAYEMHNRKMNAKATGDGPRFF